jgi:hypothetical protein
VPGEEDNSRRTRLVLPSKDYSTGRGNCERGESMKKPSVISRSLAAFAVVVLVAAMAAWIVSVCQPYAADLSEHGQIRDGVSDSHIARCMDFDAVLGRGTPFLEGTSNGKAAPACGWWELWAGASRG